MAGDAPWWENPGQGDDTPVIRHAPDADNYHVPDPAQLGKMPFGKVGSFATIPAANRDGTSKGFDATSAGPVHVDPDAPDGGVIFNPDEVRKSDINRAVAAANYPHQAFYQLGRPAAEFGIRKGRRGYTPLVKAAEHTHVPAGAYVTPPSAGGVQIGVPGAYADAYAGVPNQNPLYAAQEAQVMNPVPPLSALPPLHNGVVPQGAPPQAAQPMYAMPPGYQQPPPMQPAPPPYYPPPAYAPPPMDPYMAAIMQQMATMQQQLAAISSGRVAAPQALPATTGVSPNPMPLGRPALATLPVEATGQGRRVVRQAVDEDDFSDNAARPIRRTVKRDRETQAIVEENEESDEPSLLRRNRRQEESDEGPQTVSAYRQSQSEPEGVVIGFETLGMKFVVGPVPLKAKRQVIFEIPNAGNHMARFHDVLDAKECVVLVYDTRFTEGTQYEPPSLGDTVIKLHVQSLKKTFAVSSMGFGFSCGVLDFIVLVKHNDEALHYEDEE